MAEHTLTDKERAAIINALAAVKGAAAKRATTIDSATDNPAVLDPLHSLGAQEVALADRLIELLDGAEEVVVHLRD